MARRISQFRIPPWVNGLARYRTMLVPVAFVGMLAVIVVPMSPVVMDVLITYLARAIYRAVEVGQQIPPHLYGAVAEILAYVYRLSGKKSA